jgi:hypothetical protein
VAERKRIGVCGRSACGLAVAALVGLLFAVAGCNDLTADETSTTGSSLEGVTTTTTLVVGTATTAGSTVTSGHTATTRAGSGGTVPIATTTTTAPPPSYSWHSYEESELSLDGWTFVTIVPSASGGRYALGGSGDYTKLRFEGTFIRLYGVMDSYSGFARVTVDYGLAGERAYTIDYYDVAVAHPAFMWASPELTPGPHRLKIEWTGGANPASSGDDISIDFIEILGNLL